MIILWRLFCISLLGKSRHSSRRYSDFRISFPTSWTLHCLLLYN